MDATEWRDFINRWDTDKVSTEELADWHERSLRNVVRHVKDRSPFYRKRLAGIDADNLTLADLGEIPYTTKDDLRDAMYDLLCGGVGDAAFFFTTTGTTGRSTPCPKAEIDFDLDVLPMAQALDKVVKEHFNEGDPRPVLAVIAPNELHMACLSMSFAAKQIGITKLDLFPISPVIGFDRFFEVMLELKVNMILCSPGLLMALAEMSETYGVDVRADLSLRCLLTTGEMCTDSMKALLEETWGATAYDFMYGSQEAGVSIRTNPDGSLVPVQPTYLLEVLDLDTGKTLGFEGYGELCLTTLIPGIKPLIRYRTGDLVEISRSSSGSLTVRQFGRAKDMVNIGGHKRTAAEIENEILVDPTLVYGYELEIQSDGGQDRLLVRVKAKNDADKNRLKALIAGRLTTAFGVPADVEIHPLLDMRTATGAWVSWKTARVKDVRIAVADEIEDRSAADLARAANEAI